MEFLCGLFKEMCHQRGLVSSLPVYLTGRDEASCLYSKTKTEVSWNVSAFFFKTSKHSTSLVAVVSTDLQGANLGNYTSI